MIKTFSLRTYLAAFIFLFMVDLTDGKKNDAWLWSRRRRAPKPVPVVAKVEAPCRDTNVVKLTDALDAIRASKHVYRNDFAVGDTIPETNYKVEAIVTPSDVNLKAMVAKKENENTRMVVFRGTATANQLLEQFVKGIENVMKNDYDKTIGTTQTRILSFCWDGNAALFEGLRPYANDAAFKYFVTGHSLGGALASLFSLVGKYQLTNLWSNSESSLITFGAPRLGNKAFADLHDQEIAVNRKVRFIYCRDPAPHVPITVGKNNDFVHHSREVWITTEYLLGKRWLMWPRKDAWKVCPPQDTNSCSNRLSPLQYNPIDHATDLYIEYIKKALQSPPYPSVIYDKDGIDKETWSEAWKCSNL